MIELLAIPAMAILNRVRGGGWGIHDTVPGRALYYVAVIVGLMAWGLHSWEAGIALGASYLIFGTFGWGIWLDLHRHDDWDEFPPRLREPSYTVRFVERISRHLPTVGFWGSDHNSLMVRFAFVTPFLIAAGLWLGIPALFVAAALAPPLMVLAYEVAWRLDPSRAVMLGELGSGAVWGCILVSLTI